MCGGVSEVHGEVGGVEGGIGMIFSPGSGVLLESSGQEVVLTA